jgi:hypothetical protein
VVGGQRSREVPGELPRFCPQAVQSAPQATTQPTAQPSSAQSPAAAAAAASGSATRAAAPGVAPREATTPVLEGRGRRAAGELRPEPSLEHTGVHVLLGPVVATPALVIPASVAASFSPSPPISVDPSPASAITRHATPAVTTAEPSSVVLVPSTQRAHPAHVPNRTH